MTDEENKKHFWLYVLKLENDKYYVGITTKNVDVRVREHIRGFYGSRWTKKYRPLGLLDKQEIGLVAPEEAEKYEQAVTLKYIDKYGLDNVRGGMLNYSGSYHKFGGSYFRDFEYESLKTVIVLMIFIVLLSAAYYLK